MPVIKVYQHGVTAAILPRSNNHERAKRGIVQGWSKSAARNNTRFLRSIAMSNFEKEDETTAIAFTLTVRDCPPTSDDWHKLRRAFIRRLERSGLRRLHWVTEWQRRGVPHLHGMAIFSLDGRPCIKSSWVAVAEKYGASPRGQHLNLIDNEKGWFQYLAKHASRGADHYQRSSAGIPSGWEKTGRVWGHVGQWDLKESGDIHCSNEMFFAFRRIVRKWRLADARTALRESPMLILRDGWMVANPHWLSAKKRIISSRKMLKSNDFKKSQVRGLSEWIDFESTLLIIEFLHSQGYEIHTPDSED